MVFGINADEWQIVRDVESKENQDQVALKISTISDYRLIFSFVLEFNLRVKIEDYLCLCVCQFPWLGIWSIHSYSGWVKSA